MESIVHVFEQMAEGQERATRPGQISRLDFLKQFSFLLATACVGCSPLKIFLGAYPDKFNERSSAGDDILRAFVTTVIPGASPDDENLIRAFYDRFYPFHDYTGFFVYDLNRRSKSLFRTGDFQSLSPDRRTKVIQDGLNADAAVRKLYSGAIFLAQVSFYGGIYDDDRGCPLIGFEGSNSGFSNEEMYYANAASLRAHEATTTGNYF